MSRFCIIARHQAANELTRANAAVWIAYAHVTIADGCDGCHDKPNVVPKINVLGIFRYQRDFADSQAVPAGPANYYNEKTVSTTFIQGGGGRHAAMRMQSENEVMMIPPGA